MVFSTIVLSCDNGVRHSIPGYFLRILRIDRVLFHVATTRVVPFRHVPGFLFADFVRGPERRSGGRRCHERPERCVPSSSDVCSIPAVLRILRIVRRHSDLSAVDHLPVLHPVWVRGNCPGHLLVRSRKAQVSPGVLSFQIADDYSRGAGHARRQLHSGHCSSSHHLCGAESCRIPVPAMEAQNYQINDYLVEKLCKNDVFL